nr:cupin domain-containing protein [Salicibibacter cibi]
MYYIPLPTVYPYAYNAYAPINHPANLPRHWNGKSPHPKDHGSQPFVVNIEEAAKQNRTFRTALWTGEHLQVTLMSIDVGDDIGLEVHHDHDQFLRIEAGQGFVQMGDREDQLDFKRSVYADDAIMVPAGKWHNITNIGNQPLKLYSIYAPPEHPYGTVHETKEIAMAAEEHDHY